jgi:DNA-binding MarR family transcriptional regulator
MDGLYVVIRHIIASREPPMIDSIPSRARSNRPPPGQLDREDYRTLSDFRYLIRRFLEFSQTAARRAGLTARQHQALLAIKGFAGDDAPSIGDLAERLRIRHHSAVELVDRLAEAGLIMRTHDPQDRRRVLLGLTPAAEGLLASLSAIHLEAAKAAGALSWRGPRPGASPRRLSVARSSPRRGPARRGPRRREGAPRNRAATRFVFFACPSLIMKRMGRPDGWPTVQPR